MEVEETPVETPAVDEKPVEEQQETPQEGAEPKETEGGEGVETPETPETPVEPADDLFELPDGTKATADEVHKHYLSLLPEYTKARQQLSALEKGGKEAEPKEETPAWEQPDWEPQTAQDLLAAATAKAERNVWNKILEESQRTEKEAQAHKEFVDAEVEQLKGIDPKVNVASVMAHASKYHFTSLIPAYQNYKAIEDMERRVEARTSKNMQLRAEEPVGSGNAASAGGAQLPPELENASGYEQAMWRLQNSK